MRFFSRLSSVTILISIFAASGIGSLELDEVLPATLTEEEKETLLESSYVYRYDKDFDGIRMAPDVPAAQNLIPAYERLEPQVLIEVLTLMPRDGALAGEDYLINAYNQFRSVSSISGVLYTSSHDGEEKELFSDVYRVRDHKSRRPLPDELVGVIPSHDSITVHMKEANMGRGLYDFDYSYDGSDIGLTIRNLDTMRMIFKVLEPGGLEFRFLFVPVDDQILLYVNCAVNMQNENLVRRALTPWGYFHNRIRILYGWLYRGLLGEGAVPPIPQ